MVVGCLLQRIGEPLYATRSEPSAARRLARRLALLRVAPRDGTSVIDDERPESFCAGLCGHGSTSQAARWRSRTQRLWAPCGPRTPPCPSPQPATTRGRPGHRRVLVLPTRASGITVGAAAARRDQRGLECGQRRGGGALGTRSGDAELQRGSAGRRFVSRQPGSGRLPPGRAARLAVSRPDVYLDADVARPDCDGGGTRWQGVSRLGHARSSIPLHSAVPRDACSDPVRDGLDRDKARANPRPAVTARRREARRPPR